MTFRAYRFAGRDVLVVPAAPYELRSAGVQAFPAATLRGRAFRWILRSLVAGRIDGLIAADAESPLSGAPTFDGIGFVRHAEKLLGRDDLSPVVSFPRQRTRNRFYLHLFASSGERIAFAKVAKAAESEPLEVEANALRMLAASNIRSFRFPSLLSDGQFGDHRYLLLAPLPFRSSPHPSRWTPELTSICAEIAGQVVKHDALASASWWPLFEARSRRVPVLREDLASQRGAPFESQRAHGDLVSWNVHLNRGDAWVFDWESFSADAPLLTDEIRFTLGVHTRAIAKDPRRGARMVRTLFGCRVSERRLEVARAIAFLHARSVAAATSIGEAWSEVLAR